MIEKAAGSGSESATKIEQKSLKNESDKYRDSQPQNTLNDYNDDKPMMTGIQQYLIFIKEPVHKLNNKVNNQQRTKSPYITPGTLNKQTVEKKDVKGTPEKITDRMQAIKNMINNPTQNPTKKTSSILTTQINSTNTNSIMDKIKMVEKKDTISSKIEEYKKSVKSKGYSKSIDTNIPLNTLSNVGNVTNKKVVTNNKTPFVKFSNFK